MMDDQSSETMLSPLPQLMSEVIDLMDDLSWRPPLESEVIDLMDD